MAKYTISQLASMIERKLSHNFGVTPEQASDEIFYKATTLVLLDIMSERRAAFKKATDEQEAKTVYYLSMEFLMGRSLKNNLYNKLKLFSTTFFVFFTASTWTSIISTNFVFISNHCWFSVFFLYFFSLFYWEYSIPLW